MEVCLSADRSFESRPSCLIRFICSGLSLYGHAQPCAACGAISLLIQASSSRGSFRERDICTFSRYILESAHSCNGHLVSHSAVHLSMGAHSMTHKEKSPNEELIEDLKKTVAGSTLDSYRQAVCAAATALPLTLGAIGPVPTISQAHEPVDRPDEHIPSQSKETKTMVEGDFLLSATSTSGRDLAVRRGDRTKLYFTFKPKKSE